MAANKEIIQKHKEMFYPTVRVRTRKAGGSIFIIPESKIIHKGAKAIDSKYEKDIIIISK